ncbi:MAG: NAD(P)H-hydrate dehydratase, partial [Cyclobacteriaceae bacterium]|nr:NAD(P)H-hydrate dehydratase [Cyclobacteriaceae bacterium]
GPGIDKHIDTYEVIAQLLKNYKKPIVLDADALNIIADEQSFMKMLPEGSILTPHPGEFKRIVGFWNDDFERLEQQIAISKEYKIFVVLKGAHTSISTPDGKVYFNSTGNPGMATGGSGDVLTGIITSLLGQKYTPEDASILGVYLHGLAADIAVEFIGEESLSASDIIEYLPQAFIEIRS